jgi:hypothetical protein
MHKDQALAAAVLSERESKAAAEAAAAEQVASTQGAAVEKLRAAADREARLSSQLAAAQEAAAGEGAGSNADPSGQACLLSSPSTASGAGRLLCLTAERHTPLF